MCKSVNNFCTFLHNSKVRTKVSIKHFCKSKFFKSCNHFACNKRSGRQSKLLSKSCSDRRRCLYYNYFIRIGKVIQQSVCIIMFAQSTCRTNCYALSAICAFTVSKVPFKCGSNHCIETSLNCTKGSNCLNIVTNVFTSAAKDTFVHISNNGSCNLFCSLRQFAACKRHLPYIEPLSKFLQFAFSGLRANKTLVRVVRKNKLSNNSSGIQNSCCAGAYNHPFCTCCCTSRCKILSSLNFYNANSAGCRIALYCCSFHVDVAKSRNINANFLCSIKDDRSFRNGDCVFIYF